MKDRLQKIIAHAGLASRREAETWIEQGRVTVNGQRVTLGDKADPYEDHIEVDGRPLPKPERFRYIILNKPRGVLSTVKRQQQMPDRPTVLELVNVDERVYPVGRLDLNSEGLILLTNDGDLANRITHPRYEHEKTYKVLVKGRISESKLDNWRQGMTLSDGFQTAPCSVKALERSRQGTWLRVVMHEGHKRQIRDIGEALGHPVQRLIRTHIGSLALGDLPPTQWRDLTRDELEVLKEEAGVNDQKPSRQKRRRSRGQRNRQGDGRGNRHKT